MSAQTGRTQVQSLAAWLAALGAGDPCPWCGGQLQNDLSARAAQSVAGMVRPRRPAKVTLFCPECGCELAAMDANAEAAGRILNHAA